jgi:hypothetical protein
MKKSLPILILTLLAAFTASGQSEIHYTYDDAGNRISRSNVPVSNIFERGAIEMSQADANEWTTVSLDNTYENPVVIMGPISYYRRSQS